MRAYNNDVCNFYGNVANVIAVMFSDVIFIGLISPTIS